MSKILTALATLVAALLIAPLASAQVCADCDPGGGGGGTSNSAPTAAFSFAPASPTTGDSITFTNGSTDSDGSIASSSWTFGDGNSSTESSPSHSYSTGNTYTVTLTVTDNDGAQSTVSHDVTVSNQAPTADFSMPSVGFPGQPVDFTGQASDPDGSIASYSWSFGDSGMADVLSPKHTYDQAGTYEVSFKVYDNQNAGSAVVKKSIRINAAPTAHINAVADGVAGQLVQFTSMNSDSDGTIASSCWDFGDGKQACGGGNPAHTYGAPGDYTAKLTVTDNDGSTGTDSVTVHIAAAPVDNTGGDGNGGSTGGDSNGGSTGGGSTDTGTGGGSASTNAGGGSTTPDTTNQGGGSVQGTTDTTAPVITLPKSLKAKKKAGKVSVAITSNEAVTVVANLTGKVKGSATAKINGKGKLTIKLSSKARKALGAAKVVKLTLKITATDAAGNKTTKTVKVSLV